MRPDWILSKMMLVKSKRTLLFLCPRRSNMKKRFEKLIDVKSISTLVLTGVFSYLSIIGKISPELFMTIFTVVIGFYYGTQKEKKDNDNNMNI